MKSEVNQKQYTIQSTKEGRQQGCFELTYNEHAVNEEVKKQCWQVFKKCITQDSLNNVFAAKKTFWLENFNNSQDDYSVRFFIHVCDLMVYSLAIELNNQDVDYLKSVAWNYCVFLTPFIGGPTGNRNLTLFQQFVEDRCFKQSIQYTTPVEFKQALQFYSPLSQKQSSIQQNNVQQSQQSNQNQFSPMQPPMQPYENITQSRYNNSSNTIPLQQNNFQQQSSLVINKQNNISFEPNQEQKQTQDTQGLLLTLLQKVQQLEKQIGNQQNQIEASQKQIQTQNMQIGALEEQSRKQSEQIDELRNEIAQKQQPRVLQKVKPLKLQRFPMKPKGQYLSSYNNNSRPFSARALQSSMQYKQ